MKPVFIASAIVILAASLPLSASAQSSARHPARAKTTSKEVGGVEAIKPQEEQSKGDGVANGWSGGYAGVNGGGSFGATTGTNVVVPFGSAGKSEK